MNPKDQGAIADELLQRYFDGELSPEERRDVEARLDADARLRLEALAELRGLLRAHAEEPAVDLSSLSSTIDAIERTRAPAAPAPRRRRWIPMSAMGGLLAAAAALVLFLRPVGPVVGSNHADIESLEVQGAVATVFHVEHGGDDATIIWTDETPAAPGSPGALDGDKAEDSE
jgi:anti-sigma factor RsiW